jgi:thiamine pyrophosphate-dependent acetolactate synthase large subunit-like protein
MTDADLVLAIGASLNAYTTRQGELLCKATVVRVDVDADALASGPAVDLALHGDAATIARELTRRIGTPRQGYRSDPRLRSSELDPFVDESDETGLDLRTVARFLDSALPEDRALATDLGYFTSEPAIHVQVRHPRRQAFPLHFGSIGLGLATGIGLAASDPSVPTLCAIGDGGLCASLGELETLARTRLPVVVAVFNDDAYGVEVHELRFRGEPTDVAEFPPVDFAALGHSLGIRSLRASRAQDLPAVRDALADPREPLLVDFRLNPTVVTRWYRENVHPHSKETP